MNTLPRPDIERLIDDPNTSHLDPRLPMSVGVGMAMGEAFGEVSTVLFTLPWAVHRARHAIRGLTGAPPKGDFRDHKVDWPNMHNDLVHMSSRGAGHMVLGAYEMASRASSIARDRLVR
jgi:hypothetical protein